MIDSNDTHVAEIKRQNDIERQTAQLTGLKGAFYRRKLLSAEKIKGLVSMALAGEIWWSYAYLAHSYGSSITSMALIASTIYGASKFLETNFVNSLEVLPEGHEHAGKVKVVIALSPIVTRELLVDPSNIERAIQNHNDPEAQVVLTKGYDVHNAKEFTEPKLFKLSTDAWTDQEGLDWLLTPTTDSEIDLMFTDLINQRVRKIAEGAELKSILDQSNNFNLSEKENKVNKTIKDEQENLKMLEGLREKYG